MIELVVTKLIIALSPGSLSSYEREPGDEAKNYCNCCSDTHDQGPKKKGIYMCVAHLYTGTLKRS